MRHEIVTKTATQLGQGEWRSGGEPVVSGWRTVPPPLLLTDVAGPAKLGERKREINLSSYTGLVQAAAQGGAVSELRGRGQSGRAPRPRSVAAL